MGGGSLKNSNASSKRKSIISGISGIIIGTIITGGIGVTAVTLSANQIKYSPSDTNFTATNAEEALNEIYKIAEYKIPSDTYFYDSNTSGEDIVRYKKVDGKYYLCDENGIVIKEVEQDISNISLTEYVISGSADINEGKGAFADGKLCLGNGSNLKGIVAEFSTDNEFINFGSKIPLLDSTETDYIVESAGTYRIMSFVQSNSYNYGICAQIQVNGNNIGNCASTLNYIIVDEYIGEFNKGDVINIKATSSGNYSQKLKGSALIIKL